MEDCLRKSKKHNLHKMKQDYKQINRKEHPVRMFLSKQIKKWRWYNMGSEKIIQDINENFKKTSSYMCNSFSDNCSKR